ncbi:MAG TPA: hypothetical protein VFP34_13555 [Microlunatus sp.]|nr:hypothetical protein [Microlunatus sp.]
MTVRPSTDTSKPSPRSGSASRRARWSTWIAAAVAGALVLAFAIFGIAFLVSGWAAINDTWVGILIVAALLGGLLVSLIAFVLALSVVIAHERWAPLWLPLLLFPAILTFLIVGELFWWE